MGGQSVKTRLAALSLGILLALSTVATALADAQAPTNGGNGAGQSGQFTGAAADRPASCQSSK